MTSKNPVRTGRGAAHTSKDGFKKTGQRTVSKTVKKVPTKSTKGIAATTGGKSTASVYTGASPKTRKTGTSKTAARPKALETGKAAHRTPAFKRVPRGETTAWQKKVTAGAIAATAQSARYPQGAGVPAGLSRELQEYLEAFVAELDTTLVPAMAQRLRAGAARLSPKELAKRMLAVAPAPAPANKMAEQVGPEFYDTAGVTVVLAPTGTDRISKQAVEHRRKRRTLLALQTSDARWIYPTWQFRDHDVLPGLAAVLAIFDEHPSWSVATWLTTPNADLEGLTAVRWLDEHRDRDRLLRVARRTAHRWAA